MKKNNFFVVALLSAVALLGTNCEMRCSEKSNLAVFIGVTAVVGVMVIKAIKNNGTYKTYSQHRARLAIEKEMSVNSLCNAQPLLIATESVTLEKRLDAFNKSYVQEQETYIKNNLPKIKKNNYRLIIQEDYQGKESQ